MSSVLLGLACATAVLVIMMRVVHYFREDLIDWPLKSAVPLMLAGAACASLQFAVPRTRTQVALGLMVSAAFILWGIEQYIVDRTLASFIDDVVVFLFVVDASLLIWGQLKTSGSNKTRNSKFQY